MRLSFVQECLRTPEAFFGMRGRIRAHGYEPGEPAINIYYYDGSNTYSIDVGDRCNDKFVELISNPSCQIPEGTPFDEIIRRELEFLGDDARKINVFRSEELYRPAEK
jgi:hypothetical protein